MDYWTTMAGDKSLRSYGIASSHLFLSLMGKKYSRFSVSGEIENSVSQKKFTDPLFLSFPSPTTLHVGLFVSNTPG